MRQLTPNGLLHCDRLVAPPPIACQPTETDDLVIGHRRIGATNSIIDQNAASEIAGQYNPLASETDNCSWTNK